MRKIIVIFLDYTVSNINVLPIFAKNKLSNNYIINKRQPSRGNIHIYIYTHTQNTTNAVYLSSMAVQTTEEKKNLKIRKDFLEMSQEF